MAIDLTEHWPSPSSLWPAIVLGFPQPAEWRPPAGDDPPWLAWDQHQHGGLACLQAVWIGAMLPLEANLDRGRADAPVVLEALRALGEGAGPLSRRRAVTLPEVGPSLHLTAGETYDPPTRAHLEALLARAFTLPPIDEAREAWVLFDASDLLSFFGGWRVLAQELPRGASITDPDAHDLVIGPARVDDSVRVDDRLLAELARYGARRDLGAPRALLVWENSD